MYNWDRFVHACASLLAVLFLTILFSRIGSAQTTTTLLATQGFTSSSFPSNWSGDFTYENNYDDPSWFWYPDGSANYGDGSAMDDIWNYSTSAIGTPSIDASGYATSADSVWIDFDFFWEYNYYDWEYQAYVGGSLDEFEVDGTNGDQLMSGTTDQIYSYYNSDDENYDVAVPGYWTHYHLLVPVSDRTSNMSISFVGNPTYGLSDPAIDNVTITGMQVPSPELSLTPNPKTLNFGTATPNTPTTETATINNVGSGTLHVAGINFTGSSAYSELSGAKVGDSILPGNSEPITIQFQPFTSGALTGKLTVATDGADSGVQQMTLTGIGAVPDVSYSSNIMFQGTEVELSDTSATQYLYVNSTGVGPLVILGTSFIGLNASDYFVTHLPSGPIPPGGVDSIGVRFAPTLEGLPDAHLIVTSSAANLPSDTVLMDGIGILPHLAVTPTNPSTQISNLNHELVINFDSVLIGGDSCLSATLTNNGSDTLAIEQNYLAGHDFDFSYSPLTGSDTLIPPGGSQTIQVCFSPIQRGFRLATVAIRTNIPNTETNPRQDTSSFYVEFVGTGVPTGELLVTGPATNGSTPVGTSACAVDTFWNIGQTNLTITNVTIGGQDAAVFDGTYPALPFVLAANSSQTFTVCAVPGDTGMQDAILTAYGTSNEMLDSAMLPLVVFGTSVGDSVAVTTPFPIVTCQPGNDTATVTVMNTGNTSVVYTGSIAGSNEADFAIVSPITSDSIAPGGTTTYQVVFTPSTNVGESVNFVVTGGHGGSVILVATGGAADISGTGTAPMTTVGSIDTVTVSVPNTGTCDWTPGTVSVNAPFSYISGGSTNIPAGQSGTLTFSFAPTASGTFSSPVTFTGSTGVSVPAANVMVNGTAGTELVQTSISNGNSLEQNYPNPFGGQSEIELTIAQPGMVSLSIIDVTGKVVETVLDGNYDAGSYNVKIDAGMLASGTYYYQMVAGGSTITRQMVVQH